MILHSKLIRLTAAIALFLLVLIHFCITRMTRNPHYGTVFYKLGRDCHKECSLDKQLYYFKKAVFYDPNLSDAYYQMAMVYHKKGEGEKELNAYRQAAMLDHPNADMYSKIGRYYFERAQWDYALRYFLQSNRHKPGSQDTFLSLAQTYDKKQMYKDAVYYYVTVISGRTQLSAEACHRIWQISKIPGQYQMVLDQAYKMYGYGDKEQNEFWEQIDQYIRIDQVPAFMRGTEYNSKDPH